MYGLPAKPEGPAERSGPSSSRAHRTVAAVAWSRAIQSRVERLRTRDAGEYVDATRDARRRESVTASRASQGSGTAGRVRRARRVWKAEG